MKNFNNAIWNRLYYEGKYIVAELPATLPDCKRWIAIYRGNPEHELSPWKGAISKYSILDFELRKELIDEYFCEEDKQNQRFFYADSEDELMQLLHQQNIDLSLFSYPWKVEYPL